MRGAPGAPPGQLDPRNDAEPSRVVVRTFGHEVFRETELARIEDLTSVRDPVNTVWVEVTGLADAATITAIGRAFALHELSLEDVLDPSPRAKVDEYEDYTFVVLQSMTMRQRIETHPLSLFLGDRFVVTLQDADDPALAPVRERLRHGRGRIRSGGADYLAYALIDTVIDHYVPVVEAFDDRLEDVEDAVLEARSIDPIDLARRARRDLTIVRHVVWPARDALVCLLRDDASRITEETRVHLRDCHDHVMQLQDMIEVSREIAASLLEAYISRISLRTNEIMRVLTLIATIFIPLTFITGVYGMNFSPPTSPLNMPELHWYWGYPFSLLLMLLVVVGSLLYFRRKRWLGDPRPPVSPPLGYRGRRERRRSDRDRDRAPS